MPTLLCFLTLAGHFTNRGASDFDEIVRWGSTLGTSLRSIDILKASFDPHTLTDQLLQPFVIDSFDNLMRETAPDFTPIYARLRSRLAA